MKGLEPHHLDVLKEVSNIGVAHAATALSNMMNKRIDMSVPSVSLTPIQQLPAKIGGSETKVASIFLRIEGDAPGSLYFISSTKDAESIVQKIMYTDDFQLNYPPYDELGLSAFQEIGNILAGSFLSSLSDFTKLLLQPTVPGVCIDMAGAILNEGLFSISRVWDYAIVIETEIKESGKEDDHELSGRFLFLPDPESFKLIFRSLGVDTNE